MERNVCIQNKCIKCCKKTAMLLSNSDIQNIEGRGYNINYFVMERNGWLTLKNFDRKCVFHNGKVCLIYDYRPEGCKLYPLIFNDEDKNAVIDEECLYKDNFRFNKRTIKKLYNLITQIKNERKNRKRKIIKNCFNSKHF